jgi:tripartite-type tricarboxylate transporter receptor subunit TctC
MAKMWRIVFLLLCSLALGSPSWAQYPTHPVRLVVPASPGGASDLVARILAPALSAELGQPFIVENRVTSGGIVGTQQVAESAPDGHTLLVTFDTFAVNPFVFRELKWDPVRDFAPVMQFCRYPQVLVVHPSLGVKSVKEFVALAKEKGPSLNYGSAGPASSSRLAYELFKETAGIETVPIHYRGGGPAMQDLVSGQVQVMLIQGGGAIAQHVKAGKLTALAVSSATRSKFYPDLPTIAETDPGFESESWAAMFAPAATP